LVVDRYLLAGITARRSEPKCYSLFDDACLFCSAVLRHPQPGQWMQWMPNGENDCLKAEEWDLGDF
jgi:hypothetical protein